MRKNILLIRDRDFFFHVFQMADLLVREGHRVTILHTYSNETEQLYRDLIKKTVALGAKCVLVHDRQNLKHKILAKVRSLISRMGIGFKRSVITGAKIRNAKKELGSEAFDSIVAYDPPSLYLACSIFPYALNKIIDYSIEVIEEGHPWFQRDFTLRSFVYFERKVLPNLKALLIQDRYRETLLLKHIPPANGRPKVIHFPVSVQGPAIRARSRSIYDNILMENERTRILFFGGLWSSDLIKSLRQVSGDLSEDEVLIVHGGRGSIQAKEETTKKFVVVRQSVSFDDLDTLISSAHIGLALYPDREPNSRYTAFSSEKVARYTKSGLPFIAFDNEDYRYLRETTGCCVLINSYDQISDAIKSIRKNYERYRANAYEAFDKFYDLKIASHDLVKFLSEN